MVKIGIVKIGNIATSLVVDLLLDEIAHREDIDVRVFGTGPKMGKDEAEETDMVLKWDPDFVFMSSPNSMAPGPKAAREKFKGKVPLVVVSDGPTKKDDRATIEENGFGYIIIPSDPLIGAKTEFLDSAEMALFNADAMKVLSVCGPFRLVQEEMDNMVQQVKDNGEVTDLPRILVKPQPATERMDFSNPYARAKAMAALHLAEKVGDVNFPACFMMQDLEDVALNAGAGHEIMRAAAALADEAREIEKTNDTVSRKPHMKSGEIRSKTQLLEKPE